MSSKWNLCAEYDPTIIYTLVNNLLRQSAKPAQLAAGPCQLSLSAQMPLAPFTENIYALNK